VLDAVSTDGSPPAASARRGGHRSPARGSANAVVRVMRAHRRPSVTRVSVALLDDDDAARQELRDELARQRGVRVIGDVGRGADLLRLMAASRPDVVVLDVLLRHDNGLELIRQIRHLHPTTKIVVATNQMDETLLLAALRAGAHGYLDRMESVGRLATALRLVYSGERVLPDQRAVTHVLRELERLARADERLRIGLSPDETDLLALLAEGWSNLALAAQQGCSLATVKRRLTRLFGKLQAHDRYGAVSAALRQGVL
jgi:NarL family two-component system response regulator LiaR